ncbi:hypothetical protein E6H33_01575 [Candidatus Bathyarchaeota archaeon]|nr:MAG: hypothetical protein E6H33_01575 [Candidatus Bathyarchaeota archaeon]
MHQVGGASIKEREAISSTPTFPLVAALTTAASAIANIVFLKNPSSREIVYRCISRITFASAGNDIIGFEPFFASPVYSIRECRGYGIRIL